MGFTCFYNHVVSICRPSGSDVSEMIPESSEASVKPATKTWNKQNTTCVKIQCGLHVAISDLQCKSPITSILMIMITMHGIIPDWQCKPPMTRPKMWLHCCMPSMTTLEMQVQCWISMQASNDYTGNVGSLLIFNASQQCLNWKCGFSADFQCKPAMTTLEMWVHCWFPMQAT